MMEKLEYHFQNAAQKTKVERVLRHELVHALFAVWQLTNHPPSWFNGGSSPRLECVGGCKKK